MVQTSICCALSPCKSKQISNFSGYCLDIHANFEFFGILPRFEPSLGLKCLVFFQTLGLLWDNRLAITKAGAHMGFTMSLANEYDIRHEISSIRTIIWIHLHLCTLWISLRLFLVFESVLLIRHCLSAVGVCPSPVTKRERLITLGTLKKKGEEQWREITLSQRILPKKAHESLRVRLILKNIVSSMGRLIDRRQRNLEGVKWEIVVSRVYTAYFCILGSGRMYISQDLLHSLQTDGRIAFLIGREVAHTIAEHESEYLANLFLSAGIMLMVIIYVIITRHSLMVCVSIIIGSFCCVVKLLRLGYHRIEREADYVGLLLSAAAGYEPCDVHQDMTDIEMHRRAGGGSLPRGLGFPSVQDRLRSLRKRGAMEQAVTLYKDVKKTKTKTKTGFYATILRYVMCGASQRISD